MITRFKRLTLVKVRIPDDNLNSEVQWFSESFGLFSQRDKDKSCFRLFIALLQAKRPMSSNELAYKLNLSRATVIHHLNKLISCGLIIIEGNKYILREKNLELSLKRIKEDLISLIRREIDLAKHLETNKKDTSAQRGLILTESKIKRLVKYYKAHKMLPLTWEFSRENAKLLIG